MKKYFTALALSISLFSVFSSSVANASHLKQSNIATSKFDLSSLNNNDTRNWELANGKPMVQELSNINQITYKIKSTDNLYKTAYLKAIENWNNLGVIKLVPVKKNAQIILKGNYDTKSNKNYDGITDFEANKASLNNKKLPYAYFTKTLIKLPGHITNRNNKWLDTYTMIVAEHEIGHALGFDHDDTNKTGRIFVMGTQYDVSDTGDIQKLGNYEKETLSKYYSPQIQHNIAIKK